MQLQEVDALELCPQGQFWLKQQQITATPSRRTIVGGHEWDWDIARLDYMLQTLCVDSVQFRRMMLIAIGASTDQVLTAGLSVWVRTRGAAAAMQLCKNCFAVAEQKTWLDVCEGEWAYISDWLHLYEPNTVFIGNLPYTMKEDDVRNWVQQVMEHMPRCSIRCRRRGHWVHGKIFKRFAFLAFYVVEDAYRTLQAVDGKLCTFSGHSRHIVAYPAVKCERIVYSKKWVFHWMKGCSMGEWVLYGWNSKLHRCINFPLRFRLDEVLLHHDEKLANSSRIPPKLQPELKWLVMVKRRLIVQMQPEFMWRYMVYRCLVISSIATT